MAGLHGHVLGEASWRAETYPPAVAAAQVLVAFAALPARAVTPAGIHDDHISLGVAHRRWHGTSKSRYPARNLVAGDVREVNGERLLGVTVEELVVASAHACRGDLQEDLARFRLWYGNFVDPKRLAVPVHPGCLHLHHCASLSLATRESSSCRAAWAGAGVWRRPRPPLSHDMADAIRRVDLQFTRPIPGVADPSHRVAHSPICQGRTVDSW